MAFLLYLLLLLNAKFSNSLIPPSPKYYPSSKINSTRFDQELRNLWGPYHQRVDQNGLTIWLDRTSGSGFKSMRSYTSGYFGASIKLQAGYTAGVIACLYLSNNQALPGKHDEIDMEFLGQTNEEPYVLQTNVYMNGSGDGNLVGREMRFHLWFDPTTAFHHYAILWNPQEIIFLVDDIPIRKYKNRSPSTFPLRPMWVYGSIWDASSWATDNGRYKADYSYEPFIARYKDFKIFGCDASRNSSCHPATVSSTGTYGLSDTQHSVLRWVQRSYVIYYYCHDMNRDHTVTPECGGE